MQHAVALGFTDSIILNPRLDQWIGMEGKVSPIWRAWVPFDPLGRANGLSYYDAMLAPLAAIAVSVGGQVREWKLALGGEHQWSYTMQGASYLQVLSLLRKAAPGGWLSPLRCCVVTCLPARLPACLPACLPALPVLWARAADSESCRHLLPQACSWASAFLSSSDFIGVSVYPETPEALQPHMLEWQIFRLKNMIQDKLWLDITPLGSRGQILALEFGWGGGISDSGDSPATTGWQVASNSWVSRRCCGPPARLLLRSGSLLARRPPAR